MFLQSVACSGYELPPDRVQTPGVIPESLFVKLAKDVDKLPAKVKFPRKG